MAMKNILIRLRLVLGHWFRLELDLNTGEKRNAISSARRSLDIDTTDQSTELTTDKT